MNSHLPLSEIEDGLLAMADEGWWDLMTSHSVLESWLDVTIAVAEIQQALTSLMSKNLITCLVLECDKNGSDFKLPVDITLVKYKATDLGLRYLLNGC